ncbi:hypothetical protein V6Z12_D07G087500 [Gossypium hirsutum]
MTVPSLNGQIASIVSHTRNTACHFLISFTSLKPQLAYLCPFLLSIDYHAKTTSTYRVWIAQYVLALPQGKGFPRS